MDILLLWPPSPDYCILTEEFSCCEPLGLEYIAAPLVKDFPVELVDMRFESDLELILSRKKYDLIGLAIPFTTSVNVCNQLLKQIKAFNSTIPVVIGGHYPTITANYLLLEYVDYIVVGEGVHSFYELAHGIQNREDLSRIKGIGIVQDGQVVYTQPRPLDGIDDYLFPARQLVEKYRGRYFHAHYRPVTLMRFSAGCPYNCSFCVLWKLTGRKYLTRSNESIIAELKTVEGQNIYVVDDEAFILRDKMLALAKQIIANGIRKKYHMYVRSDTVVNNPDLIALWAQAGLDSVLVGLESVFEDELKTYNKSISRKLAYQCIEILHRNKIEVRANFIVRPEYDHEHFRQLRELVMDLNIDKPTFAVLTPFHGTDEYQRVKDQFVIDKLEFFDCYHTFLKTKLPYRQFYQEFAGLFRAANSRDSVNGSKVFYSGDGNAFGNMVAKMEQSYLFYDNETRNESSESHRLFVNRAQSNNRHKM